MTTSTKPSRIEDSRNIFNDGCSLTIDEREALDTAGATRRERGYWADEFGDCYRSSGL